MILFQQVLCLLYIASPGFWPSWLYTVFRSVLSPAADSLFLPRSVPNRDASCRRTRFLAARKQRGPSGAPAVCRIHILFTYRSDPGVQAPGPGILQARSPLALDHDTDDLFIGLFSFRPWRDGPRSGWCSPHPSLRFRRRRRTAGL